MMTVKPIPQALADLSEIFRSRNAIYGDDYLRHGSIMVALFPEGVILKTASDFNRYSNLKDIVTKISRYAANFEAGGHSDSLDDISIYAQMLQYLDQKLREEGT